MAQPKGWFIWSNEGVRGISCQIAEEYVAGAMERFGLAMPKPAEKPSKGQGQKRHNLPMPEGTSKAGITSQFNVMIAARTKAAKNESKKARPRAI